MNFQTQLWLGRNNPLPAVTEREICLMTTEDADDNEDDDGVDDGVDDDGYKDNTLQVSFSMNL